MKHKYIKKSFLFFIVFCLCLSFYSCKPGESPSLPTRPSSPPDSEDDSDNSQKGSWNNTSNVLTPTASGTETYSCTTATIDASNASEGYIMVTYFGNNPKVKLRITGPDDITYTYNLHGNYEVFPLTSGDGNYEVGVYESINIKEKTYATALSKTIRVTISNEFGPYLYPNQYVNFSSTSLAVDKAVDLAYSANSDLDVVSNVYNYIIDNFSYDYDKAKNVTSGYLPIVDEVYQANTGICFDYAAIMATMLRSQGIPTRLEVGYMGDEYHAWVSTHIENVGWINGIIHFDGNTWNLMDPTFASTSNAPKNFITDNDDYITKYVY